MVKTKPAGLIMARRFVLWFFTSRIREGFQFFYFGFSCPGLDKQCDYLLNFPTSFWKLTIRGSKEAAAVLSSGRNSLS